MASAISMLPDVYAWLIQSIGVTSLVFAIGYLIALACRQPSDRLRVLQWTFGLAASSLIVIALPAHWKMSIPIVIQGAFNDESVPVSAPPPQSLYN